ncbi:MAG: hypothetical protein AMXMBFR53_03940 [Gemmatimonadota bacterium]
MTLGETERTWVCDNLTAMLGRPRPPALRRLPRGEAVLAGNIGVEEPDRAGVLVEGETCLVVLSRRLAVTYGLVSPRTPPPDLGLDAGPAPDLGEEPVEKQALRWDALHYDPPGLEDGICIWDPVTGEIRCM